MTSPQFVNSKTVDRAGNVSWRMVRNGRTVVQRWTAEQYLNRQKVARQIRQARQRLF